jgi:hypothetical protein
MAERRGADDTPLAPPRPLSGPAPEQESAARDGSGPVTERVPAATGAAVQSGTGQGSSSGSSSTASGTANSSGSSSTAERQPSASASAGASAAKPAKPRPRGVRRARLRLVHLDPWSVMKTAFLLSIALGVVLVVAVAVVWSVLGAAGVWDSINKTVADMLGGDTAQTFDVENYVGIHRVLGLTLVVAVVDVVLMTAIATLGAFLYNLAAALLGGIEVTLAEDN